MSGDQQRIYDEMASHQSRHHHGLGFDSADGGAATAAAPAPAAAVNPAAAAAALIAARISAQMSGAAPAAAAAPSAGSGDLPAGFYLPPTPTSAAAAAAAAPAGGDVDPSTIADPVERARAIAARFAAGGGASVLGKRKADGPAEGDPAAGTYQYSASAIEALLASGKRSKKLYLPNDDTVNWRGLVLGPRGLVHRQMEADSGASIVLRGKGTGSAEEEDTHVLVIADADDQVSKAESLIQAIIENPEVARQQQMRMATTGGYDAASSGLNAVSSVVSAYSGYASVAPTAAAASSYVPGGGAAVGGASAAAAAGGAGGGASETFTVPNHLCGYMIGRQGEHVKDIQGRTGVHIQIQRESEMVPGQTERHVTITGTAAGVSAAKDMIQRMLEAKRNEDAMRAAGAPTGGVGGTPSYDPATGAAVVGPGGAGATVRTNILVPNDKVGSLIGKQGVTVQGIQRRTGVHVQIPREPDADNPTVRTVTISAMSNEAADAAQQEIYRILQEAERGPMGGMGGGMGGGAPGAGGMGGGGGGFSAPGNVLIEMKIPNERVGMVIGKGGSNIRELQAQTRTRIQLPPEPDAGSMPLVRTVRIEGQPANCEQAKAQITAMLSAMPGTVDLARGGMGMGGMGGGGYGGGGMGGGGYGGGMGGGYGGGGMGGGYGGGMGGGYGGGMGGGYGGGMGGGGGYGGYPADAAAQWQQYYAQQAAAAGRPAPAAAAAPAPAAGGDAASQAAAAAAAWQQYYAYYGQGGAPGGAGGAGPASGSS